MSWGISIMDSAKKPYEALYERLRVPHPLIQRQAVTAIFQKLRSGPRHINLNSLAGQEALEQCLTSSQADVVDQSVNELCGLVKTEILSPDDAFQKLQTALDSVNDMAVPVVVAGIGFVCRFIVSKGNFSGFVEWRRKPELHPLVKAFQSRATGHLEILQQIRLILVHGQLMQLGDAIECLRPFLGHVFTQSSSAHGHVQFARKLHSCLAVLACAYPAIGDELLKLLIDYIQYYSLESPQEISLVVCVSQEVVDIAEVLLKVAPELDAKECISKLLILQIKLCHSMRNHAQSSLPFIAIIRRLQRMASSLKLHGGEVSGIQMLFLAHMLVVSSLEQELLLIVDIAEIWLDTASGYEFSSIPVILAWVFPTIHVMSFPSASVKKAARRLFETLQKILQNFWRQCTSYPFSSSFQGTITKESKTSEVSGSMYWLLNNLWFKDEACTWATVLCRSGMPINKSGPERASTWFNSLSHYVQSQGIERKNSLNATDKDSFSWMAIIATSMAFHPSVEMRLSASQTFSILGAGEPIWSMSLLPVVLFLLNFHASNGKSEVLIALLKVLPPLSRNSMSLHLVLQVLQPMLNCRTNIINATGIRILYQVWDHIDRAFPHLQKTLQESSFAEQTSSKERLLSCALSLRDVCRKDSDRGVDLILFVQSCIEQGSAQVQALGLQSLSFLCMDDAVDFYTAWRVIKKFFPKVPVVPLLAESLSGLLKCGALDAAIHTGDAQQILEMLGEIISCKSRTVNDYTWDRARAAALEALSMYEVDMIKASCNLQLLDLLMESSDISRTYSEEIIVKFLDYEHRTRRRGHQRGVLQGGKLGKLLDALPVALASTRGHKDRCLSDLPWAALFLLDLPSEGQDQVSSRKKRSQDLDKKYEKVFLDAAQSLNVSTNLVLAFLAMQSFSSLLNLWFNAKVRLLSSHFSVSKDEVNMNAAHDIMESLCRIAENEIPCIAVNGILALGALCKVLPQLADISATTIEFLNTQLSSSVHEYAQWSSALSLGFSIPTLNAADSLLRAKAIDLLLEQICRSDSGIVRGACGIALGLVSQQAAVTDYATREKQEDNLLVSDIARVTTHLLAREAPTLSSQLLTAMKDVPLSEKFQKVWSKRVSESIATPNLDDGNMYGTLGLIVAIGSSASVLASSGEPMLGPAVMNIFVSLLPEQLGPLIQDSLTKSGTRMLYLAMGSCLILPTCVEVAGMLELVEEWHLKSLIHRFEIIILEAVQLLENGRNVGKDLCTLLLAACMGFGNILSLTLRIGDHPLESGRVTFLLELLRRVFSNLKIPFACFGAMVGMANCLGACALFIMPCHKLDSLTQPNIQQEESNAYVSGPLFAISSYEELVKSFIQDVLGLVLKSDDPHLKNYSGWALGLVYKAWVRFSARGADSLTQHGTISSLPEDSSLRLLCSWLSTVGLKVARLPSHSVASVLHCLEKAPRLPMLDWGSLLRRLMHYHDSECGGDVRSMQNTEIRKCCILLAMAHGEKIPSLAGFLNDLYEISRFKTLEIPIVNLLLEDMASVVKIFSEMRLKRLFDDVSEMLSGMSMELENERKKLIRISLWKGFVKLYPILHSGSHDARKQSYGSMQSCMEKLVHSLPSISFGLSEWHKGSFAKGAEEWHSAISCLSQAQKEWLLQVFQIYPELSSQSLSRVVLAKVLLVAIGSLPTVELKPICFWLGNKKAEDVWSLLIEFGVAVRRVTGDERRRWLSDILDMASVCEQKLTAIQLLALLTCMWSTYAPFVPIDHMIIQTLPSALSACLSAYDKDVHIIMLNKLHILIDSLLKSKCESGGITDMKQATSLLFILERTYVDLMSRLPLDERMTMTKQHIY